MGHPFERYIARPAEPDQGIQGCYRTPAAFECKPDGSLVARYRGTERAMLSLDDALRRTGSEEGAAGNFQGVIGERVLAVTLETLLQKTASELGAEAGPWGVVREQPGKEGKGFIVYYDSRYVLRFKDTGQLVLLRKAQVQGRQWYGEGLSVDACEIDCLGYLHTREGAMHLVAGEAKTGDAGYEFSAPGFGDALTRRLIAPLRELYPQHRIHYAFMAEPAALATNGRLRQGAQRTVDRLADEGVPTLLLPFPELPRPAKALAEDLAGRLPMVRFLLRNLSSNGAR